MARLRRILSIVLITLIMASFYPLLAQPAPVKAANEWVSENSGVSNHLMAAWAASCTDIFVVGTSGRILHSDGTAWTPMTSNTTYMLASVWGTSNRDVFAVGGGGFECIIRHYDGNAWSAMSNPGAAMLRSVWGTSSSDVFAVGHDGLIMHYNGAAWTSMTSGTSESLYCVWGSSGSDVYAFGSNGVMLHYDGSSWSALPAITANGLLSIWGSSASDIFAVGYSGTVLHYNGTAWQVQASSPPGILFSVWGTAPGNVYAAGEAGIPYRWNGSSWTSMTSDSAGSILYGVSGPCGNYVYAVGVVGTIVRYGSTCYCPGAGGPSSASLNTTLGTVRLTSSGCYVAGAALFTPGNLPCSAPAACIFPYGMFSFDTGAVAPGQAGRVTVTFPNAIPGTVKVYNCSGGSLADISPQVTRVNDRTLLLTLTNSGTYTIGVCFLNQAATPQSSSPWLPEAARSPIQLSNITVKSASLSAAKVTPGTPVTVTASLSNTGTGNGASVVKVYVNGAEEAQQGVTVNSGGTSTVTFDISRNEPGTYTVYVGGTNAGSFTVDQFTPNTILYISGALILFALVGGAIFMTRKMT